MFLYSLVVPAILMSLMGTANASSSQDNLTMKEEVALQEIETADGREGILAKIIIPAPLEVVWSVITDYEKLSDFIPDMKLSEVVEKKDGEIILHQQGESGFLMFHFKVDLILKLVEHRYQRIEFNQVSGDFDYFEGEWKTEFLGDRETMLIYKLIAHPKFYAPGWVVRYMLKRDIPVRLKALRERILKINGLQ